MSGALFLVDGSGFIFRAFHALPPLTRSDGTPVNAVLGFCNMLVKLLADADAQNGAIAVIFDAKRENYRNKIYPDYKAHRPPPPEELVPQFPLIRAATEAFNVPAIQLEGYEADDLIATYARLAIAEGRTVMVVSADKDLMQLVRPGVALYDPMKNRAIGRDEVIEKFGVPPEKVVDVQALAGDSVDNVPGVPGIGVKTAAQLITEYGDLDTLLARAGEIKQPARRQKLIENAELARISRQLVQLHQDVPPPLPLAELARRPLDGDKLRAFLAEQGFRSLLGRFKGDGGTAAANPIQVGGGATTERAPPPPPPPASAAGGALSVPLPDFSGVEARHELVQDINSLQQWIDRAWETGAIAVDTETDSLTPATAKLVGISLATAPGLACYIPLGHVPPEGEGQLGFSGGEPPKQLGEVQALAALKEVLESSAVLKIGHNFKFDHQLFAKRGVRVAPVDDSMLLHYAIEGGGGGHGMDELSATLLGHETIPFSAVCGSGKNQITFDRVPLDKALAYAAEDADITLRLWMLLKPRLVEQRKATVYETIERPLIPVVADMERAGIKVDRQELVRLSMDLGRRLEDINQEIQSIAPRPFSVSSPKQVGEILFDDLGLTGGKKGKTGAWSTDSSVLEELAEQGVTIAEKVLDWRQLAKLKSTYTDALQEQIEKETGRVHTSFALAATNTGRLSSTDPNLQNIPIRTEEGRKIRRAFVAEPGNLLLSVDYSQIELRLVADIAGIEALKQAFRDGVDVHAATASQVFGVPLDQMTGEIRRKAKAINFGIIYGISGFGLAKQLGITPGEANAFIKTYLERFSELKIWMDGVKETARRQGFVTTRFGRRCPIVGIQDKNQAKRGFAERQAINAPIQGAAADIMRMAMARVPSALAAAGLSARMLLQVHDELLFEVPASEAEATTAVVRRVMENVVKLDVPLVAEAGVAANWGDAH
jgi:DNA polymerase I